MPQALELTLSGEVRFNPNSSHILLSAVRSIPSNEVLIKLTLFAFSSLYSDALEACFATYLRQVRTALDTNKETANISIPICVNPNDTSKLKQELQDSESTDELKKQKWKTPGFMAKKENIALLSRRIHFQQMVLHSLNAASTEIS